MKQKTKEFKMESEQQKALSKQNLAYMMGDNK